MEYGIFQKCSESVQLSKITWQQKAFFKSLFVYMTKAIWILEACIHRLCVYYIPATTPDGEILLTWLLKLTFGQNDHVVADGNLVSPHEFVQKGVTLDPLVHILAVAAWCQLCMGNVLGEVCKVSQYLSSLSVFVCSCPSALLWPFLVMHQEVWLTINWFGPMERIQEAKQAV